MDIDRLLKLFNGTPEEKGKVKMYCVGINKKEIIYGENKYIVSRQKKYNYPYFASYHAELDFFYKAKKKNFFAEDIFIFGYRTNLLKTTKPCIYCATLLSTLEFKRIHFFEDNKLISLNKKQFILLLEEEKSNFKTFL